jgi:putative ABC transport system permease protein
LPLPLDRAVSVLDFRVLLFTMLAALVSAVISTVAPALKYSRLDPMPAMKNDGRYAISGSRRLFFQTGLVIVQIAASVLLLTGAGLLARTLWNASQIKLGFDPHHGVGASTDPIRQGYDKNAAQSLLDPLLDSLRAQPGVASAALGRLPMQSWGASTTVNLEGHEEKRDWVDLTGISPDYFRTLGIPLMQGRDFARSDTATAPGVAIVSASLAHKNWPHESSLGKHVESVGPQGQTFEIVGVAGDVAGSDLRRTPPPVVYLPLQQGYLMFPWQPDVTLLARSSGDPGLLVGSIRSAVAHVDPHLPVFHIRTFEEQVELGLGKEHFLARLLVVFALVALCLAGAGLFGLISYTTQRATHDIGVRIALGALPSQVQWMVVKRGFALTISGLILGLGAGLWLTRILASLLFGVSATDPITFLAVAAVMLAVAFIANYVPSRRATRVDPLIALRAE